MDAFLKYAKQPSNYADFAGIFDDLATFKFERPAEAQRKAFFEEEFGPKIMETFCAHLRRNKLLPGNDQEITKKFEKGQIVHDDIVDAFFTWLSQEDTIFVYIDKPKVEVRPSYNYNAASAHTPLNPNKHETAQVVKAMKPKKQINSPFHVEKISQVPISKANISSASYYPSSQTPTAYQKPAPQIPSFQLEERPLRVRFLQKLADGFEYPERWHHTRIDLNLMLQKKA